MPVGDLIKVRRDTGSNWASVDPVLASGEFGLETDTRKIKIGDGTTAWSSLAYLVPSTITLSGDVSGSGTGAITTTIGNDKVTFAIMQNIATDSLIGRDTAGTGDPENILLNTTLSMDGSGNLQRAALTGDVTASAGSNATTIANDAVTFAKFQNITDNRLLGRSAGSAGDMQEITVGTGLSLSGGSLTATVSSYTDEQAQDAVGAMVDGTLVYVDATPLLTRAALTGDVTASQGSNATVVGKITESSGPTSLTIGSVPDLTFLARSGSTIVGATPGSGGSSLVSIAQVGARVLMRL